MLSSAIVDDSVSVFEFLPEVGASVVVASSPLLDDFDDVGCLVRTFFIDGLFVGCLERFTCDGFEVGATV